MTSALGNSEIARRYATALFSLAQEQDAIDAVARDVAALQGMLAQSADLVDLTTNVTLRRQDQQKAILAVAEAAKFAPLVRNFVGLLAKNRRLADLPDILAAAQAEIDRHKGETTAEVTAAVPLDDKQVSAISAALGKSLGLKVKVKVTEDPNLLGGIVVRVGSLLIDSSVRTKLARLTRTLKSQDKSGNKAKMKEVA